MARRKLKAGVSEFEERRKTGIFQELENIRTRQPAKLVIRQMSSRSLPMDQQSPVSPPVTPPTPIDGMGRRRRKTKKAGRRRATRRRM